MPAVRPPLDCPSRTGPRTAVLESGTVLWRVHGSSRGPIEFRSTGAESKRADPRLHGEQGRFDCQRGEYGYLYAAETRTSAIAEAFLRGSTVSDASARFLDRRKAAGIVLSRIELLGNLVLADLRGAAGLAPIGQDAWLTACSEVDYEVTQEWATAIRRWAPGSQGFLWQSKRDNVHFATVLFDDRGAPALRGDVSRRFDEPGGLIYLTRVLSELNVALA
jgi:hypothetical protein